MGVTPCCLATYIMDMFITVCFGSSHQDKTSNPEKQMLEGKKQVASFQLCLRRETTQLKVDQL